uniref:Integrase core domain containing protein n=1 Tax=Solanum tuberosum TaxID=4113 RepID=M1DPZ3_SOLTU
MARLITEERRVFTGSLHTVPDVHRLFQHHRCEWMAQEPSTYNEEIVKEFYASYIATLRGSIHKNASPKAEALLKTTLVRGFSMDISEITIRREAGVPIWHCDKLIQAAGTLDIGLMRDEANVAAPCRERQLDVPSLGEDLAADVEQMLGDDPAPPAHTNNAPASPSQAASRAPSSSRATLSSGVSVVPLARVQKLEAQMATLLHHVKPWMQRSIAESEVLSSIQTELDNLRADLDTIPAAPTDEPESAPTALADDTVLDALFGEDTTQPESTRACGKRPLSSRISDTTEEAWAKKRDR